MPEGDPAHLIRELIREELDLSEILDEYDEERGYPPFHPAMMTALLLYRYTQGIDFVAADRSRGADARRFHVERGILRRWLGSSSRCWTRASGRG